MNRLDSMAEIFSIYLKGKVAKRLRRFKNKSNYITRLILWDLELKKAKKEGTQCPVCGNLVFITESDVPFIKEAG